MSPNRGTKPSERCNEVQLQCITLMILWRYDPHKGMSELADTLGVARQTLYKWKAKEYFKDEYERQLRMYKENFEDIQLADRKERVKALSLLFDQVPSHRTELKLKILKEIRTEVGDDHPMTLQVQGGVTHSVSGEIAHAAAGPNLPPRANSYDEWVSQNKQMVEAESVEVTNSLAESVEEDESSNPSL